MLFFKKWTIVVTKTTKANNDCIVLVFYRGLFAWSYYYQLLLMSAKKSSVLVFFFPRGLPNRVVVRRVVYIVCDCIFVTPCKSCPPVKTLDHFRPKWNQSSQVKNKKIEIKGGADVIGFEDVAVIVADNMEHGDVLSCLKATPCSNSIRSPSCHSMRLDHCK